MSLTSTPAGTANDRAVTVYGQNYSGASGVTLTLMVADAATRNSKIPATPAVTATGSISGETAAITLPIPENYSAGTYYIRAVQGSSEAFCGGFEIASNVEPIDFPAFAATGYTIEMQDYIYQPPSQEYNFPTVVDTEDHPITDGWGADYRYFLFYAPHDNPGGNCVAASNSLDGPWVEYTANPVVNTVWEPHHTASHISSPHVMWNEDAQCYFMYYHGENPITRYATSTNLIDWEYGGICVRATDFISSGNEASYARVFEHAVPSLQESNPQQKYIMLLMINNTSNMRKIYWAHSPDGVEWTAVTEPLLVPNAQDHASNFSGPWFMELDGRYVVICHSSIGNIHMFEVGANLDRDDFIKDVYVSQGVRNTNEGEETYPDYGRAGAPSFMQDDDGLWHMFYEGGRRLNANIVHAIAVEDGAGSDPARINLYSETGRLNVGAELTPEIYFFDKANNRITAPYTDYTMEYRSSAEEVVTFIDGKITAVGEGTATVHMTAEKDGVTAASTHLALTVVAPNTSGEGAILTGEDAPERPADSPNLELPAIFHASEYLDDPIDEFYLYFNYNKDSGGNGRKIALATAPAPAGPWTVYEDGAAVMDRTILGHNSGDDMVNAPWPVWDAENGRMLVYYTWNNNTICVAASTDGVTFYKPSAPGDTAKFDVVFRQSDVDGTSRSSQQSVYEYTLPGRTNKYVMLYNGYANSALHLRYAYSDDGLVWTQGGVLLAAGAEDGGNVSSPRLLNTAGELRLIYHNSLGNLMSAKLNDDLTLEEREGVYYQPSGEYPDRGRAADASFYYDEQAEEIYMYYTAGSNTGSSLSAASVIACLKKDAAETVNSFQLTDFGDHQVIQRDVEAEAADITVRGRISDELSGTVEARVLAYDTSAVVREWQSVNATVSGGVWTGTLANVPQGGWYRLEVRLKDGDMVTHTLSGGNKWGVGILVLCIGQSNMQGQAADLPRTVADDLVANYTRAGRWSHLVDPYDGAGGSLVPAMGNALVSKLSIPVGFIPAADSGSGLHAPNVGHEATRYWMYYNSAGDTAQPYSASSLYGKAVTRTLAAGGAELAVWNQGETDGRLMIAEEVYERDMQELLARLRKDLQLPALPIFLCQIGTHDENISNDDAYTLIRNAQHDLDDGENFFLASTAMEFARKDTAHYTQPGLNEIGKRVANSVLYWLGELNEGEHYRGPYITSAEYVGGNRAVIDVTIAHRGGTDITPETGDITGFTVLDDATKATISSAVRQSATTVRITLASPIEGSGSLRYLYGLNPDASNIVKDNNASLPLPLENTTTQLAIGSDAPFVWNLLDDPMGGWETENWRKSTGTSAGGSYAVKTDENLSEDYLNISKPLGDNLGSGQRYHWAVSPTTLALPRNGFTMEVTARLAGEVEDASNEIGVRMGLNADDTNGQIASFFLGYGDSATGFVSTAASGGGQYTYPLDTTVWHTFTAVIRLEEGSYVFDLYADGALAFENAPLVTYKGGDLIRLGADNGGRCNLDVLHVKLGAGEILPAGVSPARVTSVSLSASGQKETETKTIQVDVQGKDFEAGAPVTLSLVNKNGLTVPGVSASGAFAGNQATLNLTIPAGLSVADYFVKATANGRSKLSPAYSISHSRTAPTLPAFAATGYTIEMADYLYKPTSEHNFPSVVDTKNHPITEGWGADYRYFLFYAPHDNPGGNCVAAANSLDGPWVEYTANPVVNTVWEPNHTASHISSPHVMWNEDAQCYFMYYHGENPITRYATSTNLIDWEYGGICVRATDFISSGNEASYARVFEHEVPSLQEDYPNQKYIMLLMVNTSANMRKIYWAHSPDGKTWTAVTEPLLTPEGREEYSGGMGVNLSGAWFMPWQGRYLVIAHASSGDMYTFEVGASLDEEIHWGLFYDSIDPDGDDPGDPDNGRAGAPAFLQDDDGVWHMFYEGGKRLGANIVHAKQVITAPPSIPADSGGGSSTSTKKETLADGTVVTTKTNQATGAVTVTTESPDGTKTVAVTNKDSSGTESFTSPSGLKAESSITADGVVTATVQVPQGTSPVHVSLPAGKGNVAILVAEDGSERPLTLSSVAEGRLLTLLSDSATIRVETRNTEFSDTADLPCGEAASFLANREVFQGTGGGAFSPDLLVDRAMMVTLLHRVGGLKTAETAADFADVPADAWFAPGAAWARSAGITLGVGENHFAPQSLLTREQVALMLHRFAVLMELQPPLTEAEDELTAALDWCQNLEISADSDMQSHITRGELAIILHDYIQALVK